MTLKALFFDVDGTLADTEARGHLPAYNRAFRELGLEWQWSTSFYRKLLALPGGGRERLRHFVSHYGASLKSFDRTAERDRESFVATLHEAKSRHFQRLVEEGSVPPRSGVRRLMREADASGLRIAIVTNASRRTLEPILLHVLGEGLRGCIELIVSGEDATRKKPAPDLYRRALELMSLAPEETVAIEDSAMGVEAARAAGIAAMVTVNAYTSHERFPGAALVTDGLGEPDSPFKVITGDAGTHRWVSVRLLRQICARQSQDTEGRQAVR